MTVRTVLVCEAQVPFVRRGRRSARAAARARAAGARLPHRAGQRPLQVVPEGRRSCRTRRRGGCSTSARATAGRSTWSSRPSSPPTSCATRSKVAWLIHQYRAAYELCGTEYSDFGHIEQDVGLRDTLIRLDTRDAGRVRARSSPTRGTPPRGSAGTTACAPSRSTTRRSSPAGWRRGRTATTCCRWAASSRSSAWTCWSTPWPSIDRPVRLVIAGDGTQRANVERLAAERGVADRVTFLGGVGDDDLVGLYAGALAVVYPPFDEDFGYVTLEAFLARQAGHHLRPTAGGPQRVRAQTASTGSSARRRPPRSRRRSTASPPTAASPPTWATPATRRASAITWDGVIERLVACHNCADSTPARP